MLSVLARVALVGVLMAGVAACAGDDEPQGGSTAAPEQARCERLDDSENSPLPEGVTACRLEASIDVEVSGSEEIDDARTWGVFVNEFYQGDLPEATWFANLGMEPLGPQIAENVTYRISWDIAPGTYRGAGTYELSSERPDVEGLSSGVTDKVTLQVNSLDPDRLGFFEYATMAEPCTLVVDDQVTRGSLECPRLVRTDGGEVRLRFEWEPARI